MIFESQSSENAATIPSLSVSLRVQRSLATMLVIPTLIFLAAGLIAAGDIIQGGFESLPLLLVVAGMAFSSGTLSYSLFRGRGVPSWYLRTLWILCVAGSAYLIVPEISKYLAGERVDLASDLLVFGALVYFCFSTFRDFWISKTKQPT